MKLYVLQKSETPLYLQLHDQIVSQIVTGEIGENYCLPSIRFVARELQISVIPVKTAYEQLEKEGYIYTVQGKGCFVANVAAYAKKQELAAKKLQESVNYCKELGLSLEEIEKTVADCYGDKEI
ncbi:MAG: GntR family transcriptional regulator [Corallococcus sp.]|nr:GntR family transcriptional regulator [Corallococcus sp.]MCM1359844.1 GntR family transcriptional regulator [Corallococcus sp.]MCM1395278.1 GntR family transcriptional regulator [Corallococcus sp.]